MVCCLTMCASFLLLSRNQRRDHSSKVCTSVTEGCGNALSSVRPMCAGRLLIVCAVY